MTLMKEKDQTYYVAKTIVYTNPDHPLRGCVVKPGLKKQDLKATYPHLDDKQIAAVAKQFDKRGALTLVFPHLDERERALLVQLHTIVAVHLEEIQKELFN